MSPHIPAGYRGRPAWRDMSEYAVHFTKDDGGRTAYDAMLCILWEGRLNAGGPWGAARNVPLVSASQRSACFSEIPLDLLDRLVERRSLYGIGFTQSFLVARGGGRVWYADHDGLLAQTVRSMVSQASNGFVDTTNALWKLTPFIDFPGTYGSTQFRFEWEREWRVPGGLVFTPGDVAFLFIPAELHQQARSFFEDHFHDMTGPAYLCPYVDPRWDLPRIQAAFSQLPPTP